MRHRKFLSPVNIDSLNEKQTALKSFKKIEKGHNFSLTKDKMKGKNKIFKIRIKKAPGIEKSQRIWAENFIKPKH